MRGRETVADLFCGMGSFHTAARACGLDVAWACDIVPAVCLTYAANHGLVPLDDIRAIDPVAEGLDADIVCAGFPCQPFSRIGKRLGFDDPGGGDLLAHTLRIVDAMPSVRGVVLENVPGFLDIEGGESAAQLKAALIDRGFACVVCRLVASDWGLPQHRERVFFLGRRADPGFTPDHVARVLDAAHRTLGRRLGVPDDDPAEVTLGFCLGHTDGAAPLRTHSQTIRVGGRGSQTPDWDSFPMDDGSKYRLDLDDACRLQGFDPERLVGPEAGVCSPAGLWRMLGNTVPTCLSTLALGLVVWG